jgi:hypothetical protein
MGNYDFFSSRATVRSSSLFVQSELRGIYYSFRPVIVYHPSSYYCPTLLAGTGDKIDKLVETANFWLYSCRMQSV